MQKNENRNYYLSSNADSFSIGTHRILCIECQKRGVQQSHGIVPRRRKAEKQQDFYAHRNRVVHRRMLEPAGTLDIVGYRVRLLRDTPPLCVCLTNKVKKMVFYAFIIISALMFLALLVGFIFAKLYDVFKKKNFNLANRFLDAGCYMFCIAICLFVASILLLLFQ